VAHRTVDPPTYTTPRDTISGNPTSSAHRRVALVSTRAPEDQLASEPPILRALVPSPVDPRPPKARYAATPRPSPKCQILAYQFGGTSSKGLASAMDEQDRWRCLDIAQMQDIAVVAGPWHTGSNRGPGNYCIEITDLVIHP